MGRAARGINAAGGTRSFSADRPAAPPAPGVVGVKDHLGGAVGEKLSNNPHRMRSRFASPINIENSLRAFSSPARHRTGRPRDGSIIPLPYGTQTDWLQKCWLRDHATIGVHGETYQAVDPQIVDAAAAGPQLSLVDDVLSTTASIVADRSARVPHPASTTN
ncbi:MAG: hypothetical protein K2X56_02700 [Mycobacterium pseudokansasii]|uniref:hypothetical protein n=1 Tax=Mycobacterium pseudokansasii TaxID=2341080 RepID=UPI0010A97450|nr:hypothetical protein [Mycobacterium pseudokansasii]MBY0387037.1 hypothetical protein [Mycobacterium pseudokansasii]